MIIKICYSVFFIILNFLIYLKVNDKTVLNRNWLVLLSCGSILVLLNFYFQIVSSKLFFFLLVFSLGIFVMKYLSSFVNVYKRSGLVDEDKVLLLKNIIFKTVFPLMMTVFQVITIWFDKNFN
jgi:hypothetical protein